MNERRINLCLIAKCIIVATLLFTGDIRGDKSIGKEKPILTYAILGKELWILNADGKANIYDLDSLKQLRVYHSNLVTNYWTHFYAAFTSNCTGLTKSNDE
nr:hypothetical protein [Leptospira interrogans]